MTSFPEDTHPKATAEAAKSASALEKEAGEHHIDVDQPPSYEEASAVPTSLPAPAARVATVTPAPTYQQAPVTVVGTHEPKSESCFVSLVGSVLDAKAWASCFYFMFISITIGIFAFTWMICTLIGCVVSMLFPPVGYFLCVGTAWSWRALGRLELVSVDICVNPARFFGCGGRASFPSTTAPLPSVTVPTGSSRSGWIAYGVRICFDRFTWMCFVYFVFVKCWTCIAAFIVATTLFSLAFPFMLCVMPLMCIICRKMGEWEARLARHILL